MLARVLRSISIRNAKVQLHEIPFGFDAIHIFDEPTFLLLLGHCGEKLVKGLAGLLQIGDLRPDPFRDGDPFRCSHTRSVGMYHIYNVAHMGL